MCLCDCFHKLKYWIPNRSPTSLQVATFFVQSLNMSLNIRQRCSLHSFWPRPQSCSKSEERGSLLGRQGPSDPDTPALVRPGAQPWMTYIGFVVDGVDHVIGRSLVLHSCTSHHYIYIISALHSKTLFPSRIMADACCIA